VSVKCAVQDTSAIRSRMDSRSDLPLMPVRSLRRLISKLQFVADGAGLQIPRALSLNAMQPSLKRTCVTCWDAKAPAPAVTA
jgi:hypothetical protein